jgi:hypothetical protein
MPRNELMEMLMTPHLRRVALTALPILLAGCVLHIGNDANGGFAGSVRESRGSAYEVRDRNRERLHGLQVGMSEADVDRVMGSESTWIDRQVGTIGNPYRTEGWTDADGEPVVVRFYYTTLRKRDDVIADDELTPVVLKRGQLAGWGDAFFQQIVAQKR